MHKNTVGIERRRHPRTNVNMSIGCVRLDPDAADVIQRLDVVDISRSGLGAFSNKPFYPGQRIILNMPLTKENGRRDVYATIVRCRQQARGYRIGFQFDNKALSACTMGSGATAAVGTLAVAA